MFWESLLIMYNTKISLFSFWDLELVLIKLPCVVFCVKALTEEEKNKKIKLSLMSPNQASAADGVLSA